MEGHVGSRVITEFQIRPVILSFYVLWEKGPSRKIQLEKNNLTKIFLFLLRPLTCACPLASQTPGIWSPVPCSPTTSSCSSSRTFLLATIPSYFRLQKSFLITGDKKHFQRIPSTYSLRWPKSASSISCRPLCSVPPIYCPCPGTETVRPANSPSRSTRSSTRSRCAQTAVDTMRTFAWISDVVLPCHQSTFSASVAVSVSGHLHSHRCPRRAGHTGAAAALQSKVIVLRWRY